MKNSDIIYLRHTIEAALDRKFQTPKDFTFLSECIFERQHVNISPTTLKRLWNYLKNEQVVPSRSTRNILSSFLFRIQTISFFFFIFSPKLTRYLLWNKILTY